MRTFRLVVLVTLLLAVPPLALAAEERVPFPEPSRGEGALYRVEVTLLRTGHTSVEHVYAMWDVQPSLVPGALGVDHPLLVMTVVAPDALAPDRASAPALGFEEGAPVGVALANPGKDYAAHDPPLVRQRSSSVTRPGGDLLSRETEWHEQESSALREQWVHREERASPCDLRTPDSLLARATTGRTTAIVSMLQACGARAGWAGSPAELRVAWPDGVVLTMQPATDLPFPAAWSVETPLVKQVATMVGWRAGESALPEGPPLAPAARLPLVDWTAQGPARGDLDDHPFHAAQGALAATAEGGGFFAEHPDAGVLFATHAWVGAAPMLSGDADPWRSRAKGVPCAPTGDAPDVPIAASKGEWYASWVAPGASLFAIVDRVQAAPLPGATERPVAATRDDYGTKESGQPARRAIAPADLVLHLHDLDALQTSGTYSIDYAFAPTSQGNVAGASAVSRGVCTRDPVTGRVAYQGGSEWFIDGEARSVAFTTIERGPDPPYAALLSALSPPPAPSTRAASSPLTLATGALLVGGVAAVAIVAPRALEALFSRIHRGSALDSEKRARVMEAIHRRPGATARALADALDMPVNTLEHHARTLLRLKYVRRVRTRGGVAYYAADHPRAPVAHVLDRAHAEEVLATLAARPGITQQELAAATGAQETHLSSLLRTLEAEGWVERRRDGRVVRVRLTPRAIELRARLA